MESKIARLLILALYVLSSGTAYGCMFERDVSETFQFKGMCYWTIPPIDFTTWESAKTVCEENDGILATIDSDSLNEFIAGRISRAVFFGQYKVNDHSWLWVDGSQKDYSRDITGDELTTNSLLLKQDGSWEMVTIDPEDITQYEAICQKDYDLFRCEDLTIDNGNISAGSFSSYIGDSVEFECDAGFRWSPFGETTQTADCVSGAVWSTHLFNCYSESPCMNPPEVGNATMRRNTVTSKTSVTYECMEGWRFSDGNYSKTIECNGTDWTPDHELDTLQCEERRCVGEPVKGANQFAGEIQTRVGYRITYYCETGFRLLSNKYRSVVECTDNLGRDPAWSSTSLPDCLAIRCAQPRVDNVLIQGSAVNYQSEVGQSIVYECDGNKLFPGGEITKQVTCEPSGEWDAAPPISGCDESYCPNGWIRFLGSCYYLSDSSSRGLRYGAAMTSCEYKDSYLATVNNILEKSIVFKSLYDTYGRDLWIGYHKVNGSWLWHDGSDPGYDNFATGYPELFECARSSAFGVWKDRSCDDLMPYACEKSASCGAPPVYAYADLSPPDQITRLPVSLGTTVYYKCRDRYTHPDGTSLFNSTCSNTGTWTRSRNCERTVCPLVNAPDMLVNNSYMDRDATYYGSKIKYTCQDGYIFPDGAKIKTIQCLENRKWSFMPQHCEALRCPLPGMPNATSAQGVDEYGATDTFTCDTGFAFPDGRTTNVLVCSASGKWEPQKDRCEAVKCHAYFIPHSKVSGSEASYADIVTVTCDDGYRLNNTERNFSKVMTCTETGSWAGDSATCEPAYCPGPLPPHVNNSVRSTNSLLAGTRVTYSCIEGHIFPADGTYAKGAYCSLETLEWIGAPNGCIDFESYMVSEMLVHPDELMVMVLTWGCVAAGALYCLTGIIWLLLVIADWKFVKSHIMLPEERPITVLIVNEEKVETEEEQMSTNIEELKAEYFDDLSDGDSLNFSVSDPDLLDRASIGTTYNDRFTPDLRLGLDDCSLGRRTPTPEPTTPVATRRVIELKKEIRASFRRFKSMKQSYAQIPSKIETTFKKVLAKSNDSAAKKKARKSILNSLNSTSSLTAEDDNPRSTASETDNQHPEMIPENEDNNPGTASTPEERIQIIVYPETPDGADENDDINMEGEADNSSSIKALEDNNSHEVTESAEQATKPDILEASQTVEVQEELQVEPDQATPAEDDVKVIADGELEDARGDDVTMLQAEVTDVGSPEHGKIGEEEIDNLSSDKQDIEPTQSIQHDIESSEV